MPQFNDVDFQFSEENFSSWDNEEGSSLNLLELLSERINLNSYHPCFSLSSERKIHSFHEQILQTSGSRMCPKPKYHVGVYSRLNWIVLVISLDKRINIAFVDLKTQELIKIVLLGFGETRSVAFPQEETDDSDIGNNIFILYDNLLLCKFDLIAIFNSDSAMKKTGLKLMNWQVNSGFGTLNIMKMDEGNYAIMVSNDSGFFLHSCQDGSLIKKISLEENLPLRNPQIFQHGVTLCESDSIISITNQFELCWIELKTFKIIHKVVLDFQPSFNISIKIDQFSRKIIICEPNGHFVIVNCKGETEKTLQVEPQNGKSAFKNGIPQFRRMPDQFSSFPTIYQKTGELFYCNNYLLTQIR